MMYLIRLFKTDITKGYKINVVNNFNSTNERTFITMTSQYHKYKKVFETYDDIVIISNYKYDKLYYSKYMNIIIIIKQNKLVLCIPMHNNIIACAKYKNDGLRYACAKNDNIYLEWYYVNKCLIKHVETFNGVTKRTDYHYEKTEKYTNDCVIKSERLL